MRFLIAFMIVSMMIAGMSIAADNKDEDKQAILDELKAYADKDPAILAQAVYALGDAYVKDNKIDKAIALYEKAVNLLPDSEDLLSRLASLYTREKDYAKAIQIYQKLTTLRPANIWYSGMLANALATAGDKEKAQAALKSVISGKEQDPAALSSAADFYISMNDTNNAILFMEKAVQLEPSKAQYLQALAGYYSRGDKLDKAEAVYNKIIDTAPTASEKQAAKLGLLYLYQKKNALDDIINRYESALQKIPGDIDQYKILLEAYKLKGDSAKRLELSEKAVKVFPADKDIVNYLIDAYEANARFDQALVQLQKLRKERPEDRELAEKLAVIYGKAGKIDNARKVWNELMVKYGDDENLCMKYARALRSWGDSAGAITYFEKAQQFNPKNISYSIMIADILSENKKYNEAKDILNKILKEAGDDLTKEQIKTRLIGIEGRK